MSTNYFPSNTSKQQEMEHAKKELTKVTNHQEHLEEEPAHMSHDDYVRFVESKEKERGVQIEIESKKKALTDIKIYASMVFGSLSVILGFVSGNSDYLSGWFGIISAVIGFVFLLLYGNSTYGNIFEKKGIISFALIAWGIIIGIGALGEVSLY